MITLFNMVVYGFLWAVIGGMLNKVDKVTGLPIPGGEVPRWMPITAGAIIMAIELQNIPLFLAYSWLFFVARIIPTNALLSAVNGKFPIRDDNRWNFLQTITWELLYRHSAYVFGEIYGFVRMWLALPAIAYLAYMHHSWEYFIFFGIGIIYYFGGVIARKFNLGDVGTRIAELATGALFGYYLSPLI